MCSCGCHSCSCGSSCGGSCGCSCGCGSDNDNDSTTMPTLSQFPVYVSYPAFFTGESSINGANIALFTRNGSTVQIN